jgi:aspartyl-tRNA(Asn)/glutamyl-tRNA(Gln) amidotransferase subunit B
VLFDPDTGETRAMRTKEDAADYRYFPDPDLPPLVIDRDWVERVRSEMAELPRVMAERFVKDYALPEYDATQLTQSKAVAAYFEATAKVCGQPKLASNWIMGEVSRRLNSENASFERVKVHAIELGDLLKRIHKNEMSNAQAKVAFNEMWKSVTWLPTGGRHISIEFVPSLQKNDSIAIDINGLVESLGLKQINDTGALEAIIDEVLAANPKNVEEFKAGNAKALNGLVGPIMKASKGKANPAQVNELLMKKLS